MAKRAHVYPQVEPGAAGLVSSVVASAPARVTTDAALRLARRRSAAAVELGEGRWVLREDLARAAALGLGRLAAARLTRPVAVVAADDSEVTVRRRLAGGVRLAVVRRGPRTLGAVTPTSPAAPGMALAGRFAERLPVERIALLRRVGALARAQGSAAFVVGGLVRDVLLGRANTPLTANTVDGHGRQGAKGRQGSVDGRDLDVVVEGDGLALARALARELGGSVVTHERFLTASVESRLGGRVDVATARTERYDVPGALPRVLPAAIGEDLIRRDFTINAMAVELESGAFALVDPFGGRADLTRRRLAVLHPLSFVEDPTRIFRAARYAARLGFRLDAPSAHARALALALSYPALSGARLVAELWRIGAEARPDVALRALGAAGAFRLLDGAYRFGAVARARLGRLSDTLAWVTTHGLGVDPVELVVVALLAGQRADVIARTLGRLGLTGEPRDRVERALGDAGVVRTRARPSERARALRGRSDLALAALRLAGGTGGRATEWYVTTARSTRPALRGEDVIALGIPQGPEVAKVLSALRDARVDGAVADRDDEIGYVRHWLMARKHS
ncbi:MAG: hypothetical protein HY216_11540 [Candidatus Rokubacteria bacterium]|nr:hypothetical protein [Candidatus Rokubacteria bacterium]